MGGVLSCFETPSGDNRHEGSTPGGHCKILKPQLIGKQSKKKMSTEAAFEEDVMRRSGSMVNTKVTRLSLSLARSVWHTQTEQKIEGMEAWAEEKMNNDKSRRHGLILMAKLAEVRVLVDKAWAEKDLNTCRALEEKLDEMNELYNPTGPMERLLQQTENMLEYMMEEVLNRHMRNELRCGVVSYNDLQAVRKKTLDARAALDAATAERDMAEVYKVNCLVSALVKPYQQKYRRTVFTESDGPKTL